MEAVMLFRHGDVLVETISTIPATAKKQRHLTLAEGELTGHSHKIAESKNAILYRNGQDLFLHVTARTATIQHEEHAPIELPQGFYRVWQQREYTPERIVTVRD
jgi:hypothetical protein